jgi:hypothetical protein
MTTAIAEQLASKGVIPRNVKFQMALAEFQNNGGEYGVALAMLNAAYGRVASGGTGSPKDQSVTDASSTDRSAGHSIDADVVKASVPVAANKPGHAKRGLRAISAVQDTVSRSLFDTTVLPDGRRLRDVRWSELPELATKYRRLSRIFMAIRNVGTPADTSVTVDQVINEDRLLQIVNAVEAVNDIA